MYGLYPLGFHVGTHQVGDEEPKSESAKRRAKRAAKKAADQPTAVRKRLFLVSEFQRPGYVWAHHPGAPHMDRFLD